ncbi:MAG TPA: stalk domain-containing protein [Peptococcaceae bacterium]|nr:stalk domain-containing protein [Peptococcaceae bacterium]
MAFSPKFIRTCVIGLCLFVSSAFMPPVFAGTPAEAGLEKGRTIQARLELAGLVSPDTPVSSDMKPGNAGTNCTVRLRVNGEDMAMEAVPFIENGRALIPLRGVMEKLGAQVNWDAKAQKAEVKTPEKKLVFQIGKRAVRIVSNKNGREVEDTVDLDVPARIRNNYTYIPARFVSERLGATVIWDEIRRIVIIRRDRNYADEIKKETIGIRGAITDIAKGLDNEVRAIRVEGNADENDLGYDKAVVKITADTIVFKEKNGERIAAGELAEGNLVEVVFAGPVMESYPVQGSAKFIRVVESEQPSNQDEVGPSLKEIGKAINVASVKKMELYSLMGEKIKTFNQKEVERIISQLNTSPTYLGAHIMMLAGNNIKITFKDGTGVSLTSFGSEKHVVLSGQINGEKVSYCLICPEVGKILLAQ